MSPINLRTILRRLSESSAVAELDDLSDRQLLRRFVADDDHSAFTAVVRRHGPMVLGVCDRLLNREQEAEDVFQATFLVLARKAHAVGWHSSIAHWLYEVAHRLSTETLRRSARRRRREQLPRPERTEHGPADVDFRDLCSLVDEELRRLPRQCREALLLCYWQGETRDRAAKRLGLSVRTLDRRLERGRGLLRDRLTRRGVTLPAGLLGVAWVSPARATFPVRLLSAEVSPGVEEIAKIGLAGLASAKLRIGVALAVAAGLLIGVGTAAIPSGTVQPPATGQDTPPTGGAAVRTDAFGDPLPKGAVARLGTVRLRHSQSVKGVAFSPDGKTLASVGMDGQCRLWEAATGRPIRAMPDRKGWPSYGLTFSPDGQRLATVSDRGTVRLWDVRSGQELFKSAEHEKTVYGVAFAPNGKTFATSRADHTVRVRDAATGEIRHTFSLSKYVGTSCPVVYSPDGTLLAAGSPGKIHILDLEAGGELMTIPGAHSREPTSLVFRPDGKALISGGVRLFSEVAENGERVGRAVSEIREWDVATGERIAEFRCDERHDHFGTLALSADGKLLASSHLESIRLWDAETREPIREIPDPEERFQHRTYGMAISPDKKTLAVCGRDHAVRLYDIATGEPRPEFADAPKGAIRSLACSPDGRTLMTCEYSDSIRLWDLRRRRQLRTLPFGPKHLSGVNSVAFSPDGRRFAAAGYHRPEEGYRGRLLVWNASGEEKLRKDTDGRGRAVAFSADGKSVILATGLGNLLAGQGSKPAEVSVLAVDTGKLKTEFSGGADMIESVHLSPDGRYLTMVDHRGHVRHRVRETDEGLSEFQVESARSRLLSAVVTPDGKTVITSGSLDDRIFGSDTATGRALWQFYTEDSAGNRLAVSPDGKLLASGSFGYLSPSGPSANEIHVWELATRKKLRTFELDDAHVSAMDFSPDGRTLYTGMDNGTVLVWDLTRHPGD